jgi:hypothetical protein
MLLEAYLNFWLIKRRENIILPRDESPNFLED